MAYSPKNTRGTDAASVLTFIAILVIGTIVLTIFRPGAQIKRAAKATKRGLVRFGRYIARMYNSSRLAQSMRELKAGSS